VAGVHALRLSPEERADRAVGVLFVLALVVVLLVLWV